MVQYAIKNDRVAGLSSLGVWKMFLIYDTHPTSNNFEIQNAKNYFYPSNMGIQFQDSPYRLGWTTQRCEFKKSK